MIEKFPKRIYSLSRNKPEDPDKYHKPPSAFSVCRQAFKEVSLCPGAAAFMRPDQHAGDAIHNGCDDVLALGRDPIIHADVPEPTEAIAGILHPAPSRRGLSPGSSCRTAGKDAEGASKDAPYSSASVRDGWGSRIQSPQRRSGDSERFSGV